MNKWTPDFSCPLGYGVTFTVSAVVWFVAEVAVTVMIEVPAGVPFKGFFTEAPPPQLTTHNVTPIAASAYQCDITFLFVRILNDINKPKTMPADHTKAKGCSPTIAAAELGAEVLMVSVVETGPPSGVRLEGENVQLEAAGSPLQPNVTAEAMPLIGLIVIVNVAVWPALIVALWGDASTTKSPGTETRISSTSVDDVACGNVASP
ncbi:MAG TPA: hypothetical protein VGP89_04610, partial [Candidatus Angelobacter sp.]|nr:hypothetical protein [Candidatus Angelobacter sp.]